MSPRRASIAAFLVLGSAVACLLFTRSLWGRGPLAVVLQLAAVLLMVWARAAFGRRSFHAGADPTPGPLVQVGPYRYLRHPIYAAILLFTLPGIASHPTLMSGCMGVLIVVVVWIRLTSEERLLRERYPEYEAYARTTARLIPCVY